MVEAVLTFATLTALFEGAIISGLPLKTRLQVLGSPTWEFFIHFGVFGINLLIHWGTITGSMTAVTAALTSFITLPILRALHGRIEGDYYVPGLIRYNPADLLD